MSTRYLQQQHRHIELIEGMIRGLNDVAAGRTRNARVVLAELKWRRIAQENILRQSRKP